MTVIRRRWVQQGRTLDRRERRATRVLRCWWHRLGYTGEPGRYREGPQLSIDRMLRALYGRAPILPSFADLSAVIPMVRRD